MSLPAQITMQNLAKVFTAQDSAISRLAKTPIQVGQKIVCLVTDDNKSDTMANQQGNSSKNSRSHHTQENRSKGE